MFNLKAFLLYMLPLIFLGACMSYYTRNLEFSRSFEQGKLNEAKKLLEADKKAEKRKAKFLHYVNLGVVNSMLGNYEESNAWFEKAYIFGEDYRKNALNYATSFLTNPKMVVYPGEDQEHLYVPYYKALNYMKMSNYEAALVEVRRMDLRLRQLDNKYSGKDKFDKNAFIQLLMGLLYDATKDYNNAFIAYRNAYNTYQDTYKGMFGLDSPEQLKADILRTAKLTGLSSEVDFYEKEFGMKTPEIGPSSQSRLLFIWHNGLGPVKAEWAVNFVIVKGAGGMVAFQNEELGLNFNFPVSGDDESSSLTDLRTLRVVFPKYVERQTLYDMASITINGHKSNLELVEDVDAVAKKVLKQRMVKELGETLLRIALKKAAEAAIRKENEGAAVAASILNFATEQADTRNWQTLPHGIHYTWLATEAGDNEITMNLTSKKFSNFNKTHKINVDLKPGRTEVVTYHSLEISPAYNPLLDR